jgi:hypothetical protein
LLVLGAEANWAADGAQNVRQAGQVLRGSIFYYLFLHSNNIFTKYLISQYYRNIATLYGVMEVNLMLCQKHSPQLYYGIEFFTSMPLPWPCTEKSEGDKKSTCECEIVKTTYIIIVLKFYFLSMKY